MQNLYQMGFDFTPENTYEYGHEMNTDYRMLRESRGYLSVVNPSVAGDYFLRNVFNPFEIFTQEEMWILCLNTRNIATHDAMIYRGTSNSIHAKVGEIFRPALYVNASAILLAHCHPSGDPSPSPEDVATTRQIIQAGSLLDLPVLDHLIIGRDCFLSMKERGLGFE